jgi:hypothetical protein
MSHTTKTSAVSFPADAGNDAAFWEQVIPAPHEGIAKRKVSALEPRDEATVSTAEQEPFEVDLESECATGIQRTGLIRFVSSWSVSFVSHFILIVVCAVIGLSAAVPEIISLEGSTSDSVADATPLDIEIDTSELEMPVDAAELDADLTNHESMELADLVGGAGEATSRSVNARAADMNRFSLAGIASSGVTRSTGQGNETADASSGEGNAVNFFGASARGKSFVYVIDCSGSMTGRRWETTKRELFKSLDSLGPDKEFLILLYNSETRAMFNTRAKDTFLVEGTPANISKAKRWVSAQFPTGSTFPQFAMECALFLRPDAVFLLSDGEFQDNTVFFLESANVRYVDDQGVERNPIPIHTLAMDFSFGMYALKRIADNNGGKYHMVNSRGP